MLDLVLPYYDIQMGKDLAHMDPLELMLRAEAGDEEVLAFIQGNRP